ncbi:MAG: ZIP family metal transporter [bacterium]|nr:ZIP family metal transporter [bacterium]
MIYFAFASALLIMVPSLVGVLFIRRGPASWMVRNIHYLASFSIGVFGVLVWTLGYEAIEHAGFWRAALAGVIGAAVIAITARLIPNNHHHHEITAHTHTPIDARRLLASDAVHNVTDGFILVPAYIASPIAGLIATVAIFVHELVQETAKFFVLKEAGYSNKEALTKSFIAASSILVGVAVAAIFVSTEGAEEILISVSAGGFIYLIARDLVPNTVKSIRDHGMAGKHVAAAALGLILMLAVSIVAPHAHEGEEDGHDETTETLALR